MSVVTNQEMMNQENGRLIAWGQQMRAVHRRLQDALDLARETIEDGGSPPSLAADLRLYCGGFCAALDGHHRSEDAALFPVVLRERPDLAHVIATLMQDHSVINHLIQSLERALRAVGPDITAENTDALLRHLDGIEAVMQTHFRFEEKKLVELLDHTTIEMTSAATLFGPFG